MSFVDAGSGNPSSGSVDAIDVRHCSPHNITRIPMTCGFIFFLSQSLLDAQHQVALYETSQSILETEIRIIEKSLGGECLGFSEKNPFKTFASSQVMRVPRNRMRSRVPHSQYPRNVDTVPYVGLQSTFRGLTKVFYADLHLGSQQAGENVQGVRSLCSFKVRAEGAFFIRLVQSLSVSIGQCR